MAQAPQLVQSALQAMQRSLEAVAVPLQTRDAIAKQDLPTRAATANDLQEQVNELQRQLQALLDKPKTPQINAQIEEVNQALTARKGALELALGKTDKTTRAAQETWANTHSPFFMMCHDSLWTPTKDVSNWGAEVTKIKPRLLNIGRSVGLVTLNDSPIGTALVVGKGYVITNRHVARDIADPDNRWALRGNAKIVFDKEYRLGVDAGCPSPNPERSYFVNAVAWASVVKQGDTCKDSENLDDGCNDVAVLLTGTDASYPTTQQFVIRDTKAYIGNMTLVVIGYPGPAADMPHLVQQDFFRAPDTKVAVFAYKRLSAGDTSTDKLLDNVAFWHAVNTTGGNSGSPIIDIANGDIVGLHFAGVERNGSTPGRNLGVTAAIVLQDLIAAGVVAAPSPVAPGAAIACLQGTWPERSPTPQPNSYSWAFTFQSDPGGDTLHIVRNDGFVSGDFQPLDASGHWIGHLKWGDGQLWSNVDLTPTADCKEIRTNQAWWFRRN
jgi:S1-C subfamily serine protease